MSDGDMEVLKRAAEKEIMQLITISRGGAEPLEEDGWYSFDRIYEMAMAEGETQTRDNVLKRFNRKAALGKIEKCTVNQRVYFKLLDKERAEILPRPSP